MSRRTSGCSCTVADLERKNLSGQEGSKIEKNIGEEPNPRGASERRLGEGGTSTTDCNNTEPNPLLENLFFHNGSQSVEEEIEEEELQFPFPPGEPSNLYPSLALQQQQQSSSNIYSNICEEEEACDSDQEVIFISQTGFGDKIATEIIDIDSSDCEVDSDEFETSSSSGVSVIQMDNVDEKMETDADPEIEKVNAFYPKWKGKKEQQDVVIESEHSRNNMMDKEPDVIDLTKDDDESLLEDEIPGEDEDVDLPELIDVEPYSAALLAENMKQKGNEHFSRAEYHQAQEMYTKAIEILPTEAAYYGNRSACYMMLKKYKEALSDARCAVQTNPDFEKGYLRLIRTTLALGDVKACDGAIQAVNLKPGFLLDIKFEKRKLDHLRMLLADVEVAKNKKDHRKVLYLVERALDIANGAVQLKMLKADSLTKLGRFAEAQELCTEALQNDCMCVEAIYIRSLCLYQSDNLEKAVQFLRQGLQLSPDSALCLSLYRKLKQLKELREAASNMFSAGKYAEAKVNYSLCLNQVKSDDIKNTTIESKLNFNLALIAHKFSDVDGSLDYSNNAIELNSSYLKAILHRAKLHSLKEMHDEAVRDYEAALKIDPKLKDLQRNLRDAKMAAKRAKRKDYYKILNVDKNASEDEIKKGYKKRALVHHPDRHASATDTVKKENERLFKEVGEAYEVLSDPKKRSRYDAGHDLFDSPTGSPSYDSFDPNTLFNVFFNSGGMGGMGGMGGGGGSAPRPGFHHHFRSGNNGYGGFQR